MRCKSCGSIMVEAHVELNAHSIQTWYACTMCRNHMLTSEPVQPKLWLADRALRRETRRSVWSGLDN